MKPDYDKNSGKPQEEQTKRSSTSTSSSTTYEDKRRSDSKNNSNKRWNKNKKKGRKKEGLSGAKNGAANGSSSASHSDANIPSRNDWSFYAINEDIAKAIGSIPYNVLSGIPYYLSKAGAPTSGRVDNDSLLASPSTIMVLNYVNTPGKATQPTDGINIAASQLYTYVRHANSGAKNYEAPDMMMYVLAFRDIYAHYFECKRMLGLAATYTFLNKALPKHLLYALGVDVKDLQANFATYRGRLNIIAEKINAWAVPKYFKAFERAAYITSFVFADATTVRGQFYVFRRLSYYTWSGTASETGTQLTAKSMPAVSQSSMPRFGKYLDILDEMLDAVAYDDDAHTMSGDILKAFPESELYQLVGVPEDYTVVPIMDEEILSQIENSYCVETVYNNNVAEALIEGANLDIKQQAQLITFNPLWEYKRQGVQVLTKVVLNSHKDNPDFKDTLEWTRMISMPIITATNTSNLQVRMICGLELLISYSLYSVSSSLTGEQVPEGMLITNSQYMYKTLYELSPSQLAAISQFDWHPFVYVVADARVSVIGDLRYYTTVDEISLKQIHDSAVAASFYGGDLYKQGKNTK